MTTIIFYLSLAFFNVPFALMKENDFKALSGFSIGWNMALLMVYIIENY